MFHFICSFPLIIYVWPPFVVYKVFFFLPLPSRFNYFNLIEFKGTKNQLTLRKVVDFFRPKILVKSSSSSSPDCPAWLGYRHGCGRTDRRPNVQNNKNFISEFSWIYTLIKCIIHKLSKNLCGHICVPRLYHICGSCGAYIKGTTLLWYKFYKLHFS